MYPFDWIVDLLEVRLPPSLPYRAFIIGIAGVNFFLCFIIETYVLDYIVEEKCVSSLREKHVTSKLEYRVLDAEMRSQRPAWPPLSPRTGSTLADLLRLETDGRGPGPCLDIDSLTEDVSPAATNDAYQHEGDAEEMGTSAEGAAHVIRVQEAGRKSETTPVVQPSGDEYVAFSSGSQRKAIMTSAL
jgi:hypothetical protein